MSYGEGDRRLVLAGLGPARLAALPSATTSPKTTAKILEDTNPGDEEAFHVVIIGRPASLLAKERPCSTSLPSIDGWHKRRVRRDHALSNRTCCCGKLRLRKANQAHHRAAEIISTLHPCRSFASHFRVPRGGH
jgi:hypothetical protein